MNFFTHKLDTPTRAEFLKDPAKRKQLAKLIDHEVFQEVMSILIMESLPDVAVNVEQTMLLNAKKAGVVHVLETLVSFSRDPEIIPKTLEEEQGLPFEHLKKKAAEERTSRLEGMKGRQNKK